MKLRFYFAYFIKYAKSMVIISSLLSPLISIYGQSPRSPSIKNVRKSANFLFQRLTTQPDIIHEKRRNFSKMNVRDLTSSSHRKLINNLGRYSSRIKSIQSTQKYNFLSEIFLRSLLRKIVLNN